jgi:uncharacterized protein YbaP (TraB family)
MSSGFLFGTMHVSDDRAFTFYNDAIACLNKCNIHASEVDLNVPADYDMASMLLMRNNDLRELLTKRQYEKVRAILLKSFELDISGFDKMVPLLIVNKLTEIILSNGQFNTPLDLKLWQYAMSRGLRTTGLENFNTHFNVLHKIPYEEQARALYKMSKNISSFRRNIYSLSKAYTEGDIKTLYKKSKSSLGKMKKIMLHDRNEIMHKAIIKLAIKNRLFVAVGAAHLSGNHGLIARLKRDGFKVKPILPLSSGINKMEEE